MATIKELIDQGHTRFVREHWHDLAQDWGYMELFIPNFVRLVTRSGGVHTVMHAERASITSDWRPYDGPTIDTLPNLISNIEVANTIDAVRTAEDDHIMALAKGLLQLSQTILDRLAAQVDRHDSLSQPPKWS